MVGFIKRLNVQFCRLKTVFFTRGIHFGAHYGTHLPKRRNETKLYGESQMIFLISNFDIIWICPFAFYAILLYSLRSISICRFLNQRFKQIQIYFKTSTAINNLSSIVFYKKTIEFYKQSNAKYHMFINKPFDFFILNFNTTQNTE
eukprot:590036_1